jgi:hypothetical protein
MVKGAVTVPIHRTARFRFYEHSYTALLCLNDCSETEEELVHFHSSPLFQFVFLFLLYSNLKANKLTIWLEGFYLVIMDTVFKNSNPFPTPRVYPVSNYFCTDMSVLWCGWK